MAETSSTADKALNIVQEHVDKDVGKYDNILKTLNDLKANTMTDNFKLLGSNNDNMGGFLLGALLSRGGLLGNDNNNVNREGYVTPAMLTAALNGVSENSNTTAVLQTLGDIKASVPLAEAQVQLALAGAQNDINATTTAGMQTIVAGQAGINKNLYDSTVSLLQGQNTTREAVNTNGAANLVATQTGVYNTTTAIRDDGDKTRALITAQNEANLQRMLTVAENALAEQRAENRVRSSEINITNTNTATAQQIQVQNQQQQQFQILAQLAASMGNLSNDIQSVRQTQSNINFGTQGRADQSAQATNNRVN